ncbi:MAG: site-specific integrase [Firmicutes bacterium HGW-Firmicutes-11]|jgi:integrase|nr:MAG: site-specific integrase [Firmicutes bacterium HGW-Firmicutes-11]
MATVTKRGTSYRIRVSCGYDMTGKQLMRSTTWKPDPCMTEKQIKKELQRQTVLFEEKCRAGLFLDGSVRFADFSDKWFKDYADKQLRAKTISRYQGLMKRILPAIGHIRLDHLQPHHLISFYDNLSENGIRDDVKYRCIVDLKVLLKEKGLTKDKIAEMAIVSKSVINSIYEGKNISFSSAQRLANALEKDIKTLFEVSAATKQLSAQTILHYHRLISSILSTAVQWQVIFSNPCERVKPPRVERKEARYLDEHGAALLLSALIDEPVQYRVIVPLLLNTGMRRGELCGLEWPDIDFDNNLLHIRRTSLYLPDRGVFEDETKNSSSNRSIKVPSATMEMLRSYRAWQNERRLELGDQWIQSKRLFTKWNGEPIHPDTISAWFYHFVIRKGLPDISLHSLRHTNATLQIAAGIPLKTVSNRLGHAQASTTGNIYAHAIKSADAAAAEVLEDILNPYSKKVNLKKPLNK